MRNEYSKECPAISLRVEKPKAVNTSFVRSFRSALMNSHSEPREPAPLRDDAAMHLSFARETGPREDARSKIRCATCTWSSWTCSSLLLDKVEEDLCRNGATPRAPPLPPCYCAMRLGSWRIHPEGQSVAWRGTVQAVPGWT